MWIARATTSLPVPVSPSSSTVAVLGATRSTVSAMRAMRRVRPAHPEVPAVDFLAQALHLGLQATRLERARHHDLDRRGVERLGDEVVGTGSQRVHRLAHVAMRGDHDHQRRASHAAQTVEYRQAVHARHFQVEQQQIGAVGQAQRVDAIQHVFDVVAEILQAVAQDAADARIVVGDDDVAHAVPAIAGSVSVNLLPRSRAASRVMSPPCSRARLRAIARPRPVPAVLSAKRPR